MGSVTYNETKNDVSVTTVLPSKIVELRLLSYLPRHARMPGRADMENVTEAGVIVSGGKTESMYLIDRTGKWHAEKPNFGWRCDQWGRIARQYMIQRDQEFKGSSALGYNLW